MYTECRITTDELNEEKQKKGQCIRITSTQTVVSVCIVVPVHWLDCLADH